MDDDLEAMMPICGSSSKMENSKIREWRHSLPLVTSVSIVPSELLKTWIGLGKGYP
jgi:hypothetical protein